MLPAPKSVLVPKKPSCNSIAHSSSLVPIKLPPQYAINFCFAPRNASVGVWPQLTSDSTPFILRISQLIDYCLVQGIRHVWLDRGMCRSAAVQALRPPTDRQYRWLRSRSRTRGDPSQCGMRRYYESSLADVQTKSCLARFFV